MFANKVLSKLARRVAALFGWKMVPLPWSKLKTCPRQRTVIVMSLDCGVTGAHGPASVLRDRLAADLSSQVVPEELYAMRSWTEYVDTMEPAPYLRIYSWETGGSRPRPWIAREEEKVHELRGALVFIVDGADDDRLVEAYEEYQRFLRQCPPESPSLILVIHSSTAQVEACFNKIEWRTRRVHFAAIDLETEAGVPEAYAWLVDALISAAPDDESVVSKHG